VNQGMAIPIAAIDRRTLESPDKPKVYLALMPFKMRTRAIVKRFARNYHRDTIEDEI